jgi:hypothetical protein
MKHAPRLITAATLAAGAAARWRANYPKGYVTARGPADDVHAALVALGPEPKPEDVNAAIGNESWTRVPACDCCEAEDLPLVVEMGQPADVDSATLVVCPECLAEAAELAAKALLDQAATMLMEAGARR